MALKKFDLGALGILENGKAVAAFEAHLKRVAADCYDRPGDPKARSVSIQVDVIPVCDVDGSCDRVDAQIQVTSKLPPHKTKPISLGLHPNGLFSYNPDSPGNVDQSTMLSDDEEYHS